MLASLMPLNVSSRMVRAGDVSALEVHYFEPKLVKPLHCDPGHSDCDYLRRLRHFYILP